MAVARTPSGRAQSEDRPLRILEADARHLVLELTLPAFEAETIVQDGVKYTRLNIDGWGRWGQPGQPALPAYNLPVGMPWPGEPHITVLEAEREVLAGDRLYPAPGLALAGGEDAPQIAEVFTLDAGAYQADRLYPGPLAEATDNGFLRDQPLFQLKLYPFQYNPKQQTLAVYRRLKVLVTFPAAPPAPSRAAVEPTPPTFDKILQRTLVNYDSLPRPAPGPGKQQAATPGATYLIITHPDFYNAVQSLKTYREGQGETVKVATTTEIYNQYNNGNPAAWAIRSYLIDAYDTWSPRPVYVLLVGDASANTSQLSEYLPALYDEVILFGSAPNDTRYAKVHGDDIYPDYIVGRIPARSSGDVTTVLNKIVAYEQTPPAGNWARRAILVADNDMSAFQQDMETIANILPASISPTKLYDYDPSTSVSNEISQGALVVAYSGHGNQVQWGTWAGAQGKFFQKSDITNLQNGTRLPFLTIANCENGYFASTQRTRVLAEEFLLAANRGGIASFAPSSFAFPSVNTPVHIELYETLFNDNNLILGSAATTAKLQAYLANSSLPLTLFEVFTYFGDPAVKLNRPATLALNGDAAPNPVVMGQEVTYSLDYSVSGADEAPGLTLVSTLPSHLSYQSAWPAPSSVQGQTVTWSLGDVPAGSRTVTMTAAIDVNGLGHGQLVSNEARLYDYFAGDQVAQLETTVLEAPIAGLAAGNDSPAFLGSQTAFTATIQNGSNVVYSWDFGDGSPAKWGPSVNHTYAIVGTHLARVTATNAVSSQTAITTVEIRDVPPLADFVSSAPDTLGQQPTTFQSVSAGTNLAY
ncbi:MAG: C25 family cysteine peptidase, partial [Anaerolineae bacterium]